MSYQLKSHSKNLADAIQPVDYAIFMDHGYRGLYGGRASGRKYC